MANVKTVQRGGSRFYVDQETRVTVPGVTSTIGMLPKPFLRFWGQKLVAEAAVNSFAFLSQMIATAGEGAAVDYLKGAPNRYTKLRANIGSDAHDMFERMIRGEGRLTERDAFGQFLVRVHPDMEPYRRGFAEFLDAVNPELVRAEDIAWSDIHQYAGSFDAILRVWVIEGPDGKLTIDPTHGPGSHPVLLIVDWKTSKDTYPDVALQMSAYAHADKLIDSDGNEEPMPEFDGAAVLHITPEQWAFKPVDISVEVFDFFLALRKVFDWDRTKSKTVLGKPLSASQYGKLVTGTQRRGK
ncbi:hypothetical protein ACFVYV_09425 [Streptomyces mirabilis]|uniref:hypothetical protein n=1 Tax=Streptomyces mirabilis TaxID=68239 RepID=UPI0036DB6BEE